MAWGSNISEVRFNAPVIEFDPATWSQIGQRKREEDRKTKATESVAMARKEIRDRFQTKRENEAYASTKSQLEAQLKQAESELKEIDNQIAEFRANVAKQETQDKLNAEPVAGAVGSPTNAFMQRGVPTYSQAPTKGYSNSQSNRSSSNMYSEMPIFGQKRGGMQ